MVASRFISPWLKRGALHRVPGKTERLRWQKENKLEIVKYKSLNKWGTIIEVPYYDYFKTISITSDDIEKWRNDHKTCIKTGSKARVINTKITKQERSLLRKNSQQEIQKEIDKWFSFDEKLGVTLELSFWTRLLSCWAKTNQKKAKTAYKRTELYNQRKDFLYDLKNQACIELVKSPYVNLSFYEPEKKDKVRINLCEKHYYQWCDERKNGYLSVFDFYNNCKDDINRCNKCYVDIENDYYSLFFLKIDSKIESFPIFSFHIPYSVGVFQFPEKSLLQRVYHQENEGMFRFGRILEDDEQIVYSEYIVEKKFEQALIHFKLVFS